VPQSDEGPYCESWRRYRRWYALSLGLAIAYLPVFAILANLLPAMQRGGAAIVIPFLLYGGTWVAASNVARDWECPRCGETFFG